MAGKVGAAEYIDFLVASPHAVSGTEAARRTERGAAHDADTRRLHRLEPDAAAALWGEAAGSVEGGGGWCWTTACGTSRMRSRARWWRGSGRASTGAGGDSGSEGRRSALCDYRLYEKDADGRTKHDHARAPPWPRPVGREGEGRETQGGGGRRVKERGTGRNGGGHRRDGHARALQGTAGSWSRLVATDGDTEYWATHPPANEGARLRVPRSRRRSGFASIPAARCPG